MFRMISSGKKIHGLSNIFCSTSNRNFKTCIDMTSTGVSFYDSFLDPKQEKYLRDQKNLESRIQFMTPQEYYEACATKIFRNSSVESLKMQRKGDPDSIEYLTKALESGRKFHLPYLNYATGGQEGLHRMMVLAEKYGWNDADFPVLVVDYADDDLEKIRIAKKALNIAIRESLTYSYVKSRLPDEFISQIQWELDKYDEDSGFQVICLNTTSDYYEFSLEGYDTSVCIRVDTSEIHHREGDTEDDDFDIDESLLDMDSDELLKLLDL